MHQQLSTPSLSDSGETSKALQNIDELTWNDTDAIAITCFSRLPAELIFRILTCGFDA